MSLQNQPHPTARICRQCSPVIALLLHALLLASSPSICAGEFQILQDTTAGAPATTFSDAPSDVPSTSPSLPNQGGAGDAPSAVPTIAFTYQPTTIPICPQEWTQYRSCFQKEMPTSEAYDCDMCVGASLPRQGPDTTCDEYSSTICDALTTACDCAPCQDDIELYFRCTYAELGLDCPLDCGLIAAPTAAPSSAAPTAVNPNDASTGSSATNATTTPAGSTSGADAVQCWGRGRPDLVTLAGAAIVGAVLLWL
jgi:hypothetical protein